MNDLNQCSFIGRLGQNPDTKYTQGGTCVCTFSIACGWKSKDKEGTEWINMVAFGKLGEICSQYLQKGSQIYAQGKFKTDKYDKNGETRYSTKIVLDNMQMLGSKGESPTRGNPSEQPRDYPATPPADEGFDDIPF